MVIAITALICYCNAAECIRMLYLLYCDCGLYDSEPRTDRPACRGCGVLCS